MLIKHLKPNVENPRKISHERKENLNATMDEFGDLSGITFNIRTGNLATGHQRVSQMDQNAKIIIEHKYSPPTEKGTIAEGYITFNGEKFKYREVDWDDDKHTRAMLCANEGGGEFDTDLLRVAFAKLKFNLKNTGFTLNSVKKYNIEIPSVTLPEIPVPKNSELFNDMNSREESNDLFNDSDEDSDASYLKENPGPDSNLNKENFDIINRDTQTAFDQVTENTESKLKQILIVIECPSKEQMFALKEKIRSLNILKDYESKMF